MGYKDSKCRRVQLTINNPLEKNASHDRIREIIDDWSQVQYYCMADEQGSTYHTHVFIAFHNTVRFSTIKNKFPQAHIERCYGTAQENRDYILKQGKWKDTDKEETRVEGTFEEYGECPVDRKGQRTDIIDQYQMIKDGYSNYDILEEYDGNVQLERLYRMRAEYLNEKYKRKIREVKVIYCYGKTGTGKTYTAFKETLENNETLYKIDDYKNPFDMYDGEKIVLFDDWRDREVSVTKMLRLLDIYPLKLECRYSPKIAQYEKVYITSNQPLESVYNNKYFDIDNETINAFRRRITEYRVYTEKGKYEVKKIGRIEDKMEDNPFEKK